MSELMIKKRGREFREAEIEEIENLKRYCIEHGLQASLIIYEPLWKIAEKFRKKQKKI